MLILGGMKATKPCNLPSPFDAKKIARLTQNGPNHSMSRCGVRDKVRMKVIFLGKSGHLA